MDKIKQLEHHFNTMQCPDCGGIHQCRLYKDAFNEILVTFIESKLSKSCWGYRAEVQKQINALENKM